MDIVKERLEREFNLELIATAPNVEFRVHRGDELEIVHNPAEMPAPGTYDSIEEPMVYATIITPADYLGAVMETSQSRRGEMVDMSFITPERVEIHYVLPLAEIVFDFFDQLKSRTKGYASLDYEPWGYQEANLVRVDVLLHGEPVDAFSTIVHRDKAYIYGKQMVERLKDLIPRQLFDVAIQAAIGAKIIARETVKAKRKDVTAKCYGGDISRKRKLLEQQKKGKARMRRVGRVDVPQEAFIAALRVEDGSKRNTKNDRRRRARRGTRSADLRPRSVLPHPVRLLRLQRVRRPGPPGASLPPGAERPRRRSPRRRVDGATGRRACSSAEARRRRSDAGGSASLLVAPSRDLRRGGRRRGHDGGESRHRGRGSLRALRGAGLRTPVDGRAVVRRGGAGVARTAALARQRARARSRLPAPPATTT